LRRFSKDIVYKASLGKIKMATKVLKRSKTGEIYHPGSNIVFTPEKVAYGVLVNGKTEPLGSEQVALCNELGFKYDPKKVLGYQSEPSETSGEEDESSDDGEGGSGEEEEAQPSSASPVASPPDQPVSSTPVSLTSQPEQVRECSISQRCEASEQTSETLSENTFLAMMRKMHADSTVTLPERERELTRTRQELVVVREQLATTAEKLTSTTEQLATVQKKFDIIRSAFS
jgi:hypothetical protein